MSDDVLVVRGVRRTFDAEDAISAEFALIANRTGEISASHIDRAHGRAS